MLAPIKAQASNRSSAVTGLCDPSSNGMRKRFLGWCVRSCGLVFDCHVRLVPLRWTL